MSIDDMRTLWICLALVMAHPCGLLAGADDSGASGLFSSYDVIELTLEAPLDDLFERARGDPESSVRGSLSYRVPGSDDRIRIDDIVVSTRGHSSLREEECSFPKLKLKLSGSGRGPLFDKVGTVKIGTHCGDRPDGELTRRYGRLANEKAAHREAFVYRLLEAVEVASLKARPARITYSNGSTGEPIVRDAMLLEDDDAALKRLGGVRQIDPTEFRWARDTFTDTDTARLALAEAMIGNFDWCLRLYEGDNYRCNGRHPLWNVLAFVGSNGVIPVIHDFDLAGLVVGRHPWFGTVYNQAFARSRTEIEVLGQVQRTRSLFPRPVLDAARAGFVRRKPAAYQALREAALDAGWQQTIQEYLDSFFAAIETDEAFYRPVVTDSRARAYLDADAKRPLCQDGGVPAGTVVGASIETRGDMSRVLVLDSLWHWASKKECEGVRQGPVWIATKAIGKNYPEGRN